MRRNSLLQRGLLVLGFILLLAAVGAFFWANYRYTRENPGGNDFLVHWVGTRSFLMEGISPYSDSVALEIQTRAYGRAARPGEHELRVAYPLYSQIFFAPFALVADYPLARALWMTFLELCVVLLAILSLRLTGWRPGLWLLPLYLLFALSWYHSVRPIINGNAVVLIALLVGLALLAIRNGRDELAGILLAFSTIKPQVVIILILFVLIWALTRRRWQLPVWFFGSLLLLSLLGMLFLPDWVIQNIREIVRYPGYNPPGTPGTALAVWLPGMGERIGWILSGLLSVLMLIEWWQAVSGDERQFLWTAGVTLTVSQWIGIQTDPGNYLVTFPALVLVFALWSERWRRAGRLASLLSMLILFTGLWSLFLQTVGSGPQPQQSPIMFFPLPLFLLPCLYWVRWWAIRPARVWLDEYRESIQA